MNLTKQQAVMARPGTARNFGSGTEIPGTENNQIRHGLAQNSRHGTIFGIFNIFFEKPSRARISTNPRQSEFLRFTVGTARKS